MSAGPDLTGIAVPVRSSISVAPAISSGLAGDMGGTSHARQESMNQQDLDAIFNTSDYFDLSATSPQPATSNAGNNTFANFGLENVAADSSNNQMGGSSMSGVFDYGVGNGSGASFGNDTLAGVSLDTAMGSLANDVGASNGSANAANGAVNGLSFDYTMGNGGFGGEVFMGEGMDTVSDGLNNNDSQGM